ncbi:hypothetical protein AMECASPLE_031966, partial [Ameca splendens]
RFSYKAPNRSIHKHSGFISSVFVFIPCSSASNRWSLWFFKNDKSKTWQANLRLISKFDTVEDFWALYNHIQLSSNLMSGCDYSLFKDGIEPMWEDERNKRGGRWLITLTKQQRRSDLDRYWLETVGLTVFCRAKPKKPSIISGPPPWRSTSITCWQS